MIWSSSIDECLQSIWNFFTTCRSLPLSRTVSMVHVRKLDQYMRCMGMSTANPIGHSTPRCTTACLFVPSIDAEIMPSSKVDQMIDLDMGSITSSMGWLPVSTMRTGWSPMKSVEMIQLIPPSMIYRRSLTESIAKLLGSLKSEIYAKVNWKPNYVWLSLYHSNCVSENSRLELHPRPFPFWIGSLSNLVLSNLTAAQVSGTCQSNMLWYACHRATNTDQIRWCDVFSPTHFRGWLCPGPSCTATNISARHQTLWTARLPVRSLSTNRCVPNWLRSRWHTCNCDGRPFSPNTPGCMCRTGTPTLDSWAHPSRRCNLFRRCTTAASICRTDRVRTEIDRVCICSETRSSFRQSHRRNRRCHRKSHPAGCKCDYDIWMRAVHKAKWHTTLMSHQSGQCNHSNHRNGSDSIYSAHYRIGNVMADMCSCSTRRDHPHNRFHHRTYTVCQCRDSRSGICIGCRSRWHCSFAHRYHPHNLLRHHIDERLICNGHWCIWNIH